MDFKTSDELLVGESSYEPFNFKVSRKIQPKVHSLTQQFEAHYWEERSCDLITYLAL